MCSAGIDYALEQCEHILVHAQIMSSESDGKNKHMFVEDVLVSVAVMDPAFIISVIGVGIALVIAARLALADRRRRHDNDALTDS